MKGGYIKIHLKIFLVQYLKRINGTYDNSEKTDASEQMTILIIG